jgi:hypothetical protein
MLTIDRLSLQLPAGFEARSDEVLRLMADELARLPMDVGGQLSGLQLPPIEMNANWDERQLARHIAQVIRDSAQASLQNSHSPSNGEKKP